MMMQTRLFLFPVSETIRRANANDASSTSFVGAIAARQTWPHVQVPPDPQIITHFLYTLLPPQSLFVLSLQRGVNPAEVLAYLRGRSLAYRVKMGSLDYKGSVGFAPLANLWGRHPTDSRFVFRSSAGDDLNWVVRRFGSLDRVRIFGVAETEADHVEERLTMPSSVLSYDNLLDQSHFVGLFDYDWDYFFCFSRKLSVGHLVNHFRTVCQSEGVAAETVTDRVLLHKAFRRAEKLLGFPGLKVGTAQVQPV